MRIRLLQILSSIDKARPAGGIYEWEDVDARRLIKNGLAEPVIETATLAPIAELRKKRGSK